MNSEHTVLVVDDSPDDLMLVRMAARRVAPSLKLRTIKSGEEALSYLSAVAAGTDPQACPMPTLILLDLKMPRVDGFGVLSGASKLKLIPRPFIVVMSSSALPEDQQRAMYLGATAYHTKPAAFDDLCVLLKKIFEVYCSESATEANAAA